MTNVADLTQDNRNGIGPTDPVGRIDGPEPTNRGNWIDRSKTNGSLKSFKRFLIEKIRVNPDYHFLGLDFTQAEMISFSFVLLGIIGIVIFNRGTNKTAEH